MSHRNVTKSLKNSTSEERRPSKFNNLLLRLEPYICCKWRRDEVTILRLWDEMTARGPPTKTIAILNFYSSDINTPSSRPRFSSFNIHKAQYKKWKVNRNLILLTWKNIYIKVEMGKTQMEYKKHFISLHAKWFCLSFVSPVYPLSLHFLWFNSVI